MPTSFFYPGDLAFQPGLKFHSDYMRFFSPFARAEIYRAGLKFQPGPKLSSCNRKRRFKKICSRNRAEFSARLTGLITGLKSQPGPKFAM